MRLPGASGQKGFPRPPGPQELQGFAGTYFGTLNIENQVTSLDVLKKPSASCLKTGNQRCQERMVGYQFEDPLLRHCAIELVVLYNDNTFTK